jgi:hypothetical protein
VRALWAKARAKARHSTGTKLSTWSYLVTIFLGKMELRTDKQTPGPLRKEKDVILKMLQKSILKY